MVHYSKLPALTLPKCSILDYLFPAGEEPSDKPQWINSKDTSQYVSPKGALGLAKRLGFGLQRLGVVPGDVCLLFTPNHIYVPVSYLAIVGAGASFSGANPTFTATELEYQITVLQPKVIFVHPDLLETAKAAIKRSKLDQLKVYLFADYECRSHPGLSDWRDVLGTVKQGESWEWRKLSPQEAETRIAAINFSSGTTGLPKGVCVSHYNVVANVEQIKSLYDFSSLEKWAGFLPLYHAYGQCYGIILSTTLKIPMLIIEKFDFEEYLRLIQEHKIRRLQTVPPIMIMLSKRPETAKYDLSSVKEMLCGAAPLSKELQYSVADKFNVRITQGWGMTETTCAATGVPYYESYQTGSIGVLMPNTQLMLLDDDGKEVGFGEKGEMHVKGPQIALGYWKNPTATEETFNAAGGGWLKTGDVAIMKEDGFMWIVDRIKELIKVKALQVSPAELEASLLEHPDIADVGVVGITLDDNEWPRAYVKLEDAAQGRLTPKQIQQWLAAKVSKHKQLVGGVMIVPDVPRLPSGKIQRKVMREWAKRDALAMGGGNGKL